MTTILMPVAGAGSRFAETGEPRPKPLIEINGRPMAAWALASVYSAITDARVVFIVLREHEEKFGILSALKKIAPTAQFAVAEKLTGGSMQSCLLARDIVEQGGDDGLIVLDCDLAFHSQDYFKIFQAIQATEKPDGVLLSFRSREPKYSYAEVEQGRVVRTTEKDPISDHALVGAYGFRSAKDFFATAADLAEKNIRSGNGEFYTSNVYNAMIAKGAIIACADVENYWSFGTPSELAACEKDPAFGPFLNGLIKS